MVLLLYQLINSFSCLLIQLLVYFVIHLQNIYRSILPSNLYYFDFLSLLLLFSFIIHLCTNLLTCIYLISSISVLFLAFTHNFILLLTCLSIHFFFLFSIGTLPNVSYELQAAKWRNSGKSTDSSKVRGRIYCSKGSSQLPGKTLPRREQCQATKGKNLSSQRAASTAAEAAHVTQLHEPAHHHERDWSSNKTVEVQEGTRTRWRHKWHDKTPWTCWQENTPWALQQIMEEWLSSCPIEKNPSSSQSIKKAKTRKTQTATAASAS